MLTYVELVSLSHLLRDQMVLTVYLDGAADNPAARNAWRVELDHSLKEIKRRLATASHDQRATFERCLELLDAQLVEVDGAIGAPGWVAFISADGVHDVEQLPAPTPTLAAWRTGMLMGPYVRVLKQTRPVVIVVADARKATLYRYAAGLLRPAETIHAHAATEPPTHMGDEARPGFHPGTRGTTGRDATQHALQAGTSRMIHDVANRVVALAAPNAWILTGGIPEVSAHIARALQRGAGDRVLQLEALDVHATGAQIAAAAQEGASYLRDQADLRHVSEIIASVEGETVARGADATRQALEEARVRELYFTPRYLEEHLTDAEDAVRAAVAQGAAVEEVSRAVAQLLDQVGGIGARLRYALSHSVAEEGPEGEGKGEAERSTAPTGMAAS